MQYHFNEIEKSWQRFWAQNQTFKARNKSEKPKYYVLDMFPYPSGAGLHVGHPLGYIASDIYARYKRHKGFNVLHPQGYDSFGLPAEQYAIQTGQHPAVTTKNNIETYRRQLDRIGFSFDWSREVRTSDPNYYKWTQWIFIQLFESWYCKQHQKAFPISELIHLFEEEGNEGVNLACEVDTEIFTADEWNNYSSERKQKVLLNYRLDYLAETEVNWCPELGTVLANDEIVNGVSERGGHPVIRKKMTQWIMRISAFAERLLEGLDDIDCAESLKETQRNWIGRSEGASVSFKVKDHNGIAIDVFTTRPDTIFGVSFMTLAPEHELVKKITTADRKDEVDAYIEATSKRSERDRMSDVKTITGVFTGAYAEHPFTKESIPIWIGDYVLAGYGTGAVMSVPCGDQRDYDFAQHFNIDIPNIFKGIDISEEAFSDKEKTIIANSDFLNDLNYKEATSRAIEELKKLDQGERKINYRLRDAVFSRQRYWGEPFPVYYVNEMPQMISKNHLPLKLPEVESYLPTEDGSPPLGRAEIWAWDTNSNQVVHKDRIDHVSVFPLELNTMPGWAGSSWYFFRYMEKKNRDQFFASEKAIDYWENVDLYVGGSEHATGHLLYSRFWVKFLKDRGIVNVEEPFKKLINQGMILGTSAIVYRVSGSNQYVTKSLKDNYLVDELRVDVNLVDASNELDIEAIRQWQPQFENAEFILEDGKYMVGREVEKMSKSKYNVVNPDSICDQYGADSLRLYEMFLGPLEQAKPWNTAGITGVHSFLKKLWKLYVDDKGLKVNDIEPSKESLKTLHKTIKKVEEDIEGFSFNTSVSTFMIAVNELTQQKCTSRVILEPLLILLSPYAPHIAEHLYACIQLNEMINVDDLPEDYEGISQVTFPSFDQSHLVLFFLDLKYSQTPLLSS